MAIAPRIREYLAARRATYDVVAHPHSQSSIQTAELAHVSGERLVKAVVLEDEDGRLIAVLPSTRAVHVGHVTALLGRRVRLADESDLAGAFPDCEPGAVPPLGAPYGVRTLLDESIGAEGELFLEAGDHAHLLRMDAAQFLELVGPAERVALSQGQRHHGKAGV